MEIQGKKVLILGGYGLVGFEVAKHIMKEKPKSLIILSLRESESKDAVERLHKLYPDSETQFLGEYGNIFITKDLKDTHLQEVKDKEELRVRFIKDIFDELDKATLEESFLYHIISKHRPDIVVDSINTASTISYQNTYRTTGSLRDRASEMKALEAEAPGADASKEELLAYVEKMKQKSVELRESADIAISSLYIPQLVRHVQILHHAINDNGVRCYIKVGTSGTGGMGLNIPYTHGEERPSRMLLSKSAVGGAHTLLLFLLARTPGDTMIKEIKPTAAIAWRAIEYGPVKKGYNVRKLYNVSPPMELKDKFCLAYTEKDEEWKLFTKTEPKVLNSVYIDTGENGLFSKGEFEAITSMQQMEFVTPEEIANNILFEILGRNTGHDVVNAMDSASMGPTYRAGFLRTYALRYMNELESRHKCSSVAFEMLGPPRLSKLLFECHLLKLAYGKIASFLEHTPAEVSKKLEELILNDERITSEVVSIGIPVLLKDGKRLLRGPFVKIPPNSGKNEIPMEEKDISVWARDGWVDLREENCKKWQERIKLIQEDLNSIYKNDTSSAAEHGRMFEVENGNIEIGEIVGWIFNQEDQGARIKE